MTLCIRVCVTYLLSSKSLVSEELASTLSIEDFVLMRHVLVELSNSNDLHIKDASDRHEDAQDSGSLLSTTLSSFTDM